MKKTYLLLLLVLISNLSYSQCGQVDSVWVTYGASNGTVTNPIVHWQMPSSGTVPLSYNWEAIYNGGSPGTGQSSYSGNTAATNTNSSMTWSNTVNYKFWIRTVCSGGVFGNWKSFDIVHCFFEPPYLLDFNSTTAYPSCSEVSLGSGDIAGVNWAISGSGNNELSFCHQFDPCEASFFTPYLNQKKDTTYTLSLDWHGNYQDWIVLSNFGILPSMGAGNWATEYIPTDSQPFRLHFDASSNGWGSGCYYADNILVKKTTCGQPKNVKIIALTTTTALLTWKSPKVGSVSSYKITYNQGTLNGINDTSALLTGLTPGTIYNYSVKTNCSSPDESIGTEGRFTTPCLPVDVPYTQNFDAAFPPNLPSCTIADSIGNSQNWKTAAGYAFYTGNVLMQGYYSPYVSNAWFYTRGLNLVAGTSYRLTFKYSISSANYGENLAVKFGFSPLTSAMTNSIVSYSSVGANPSVSTTLFTPAVSGIYYIGFHSTSSQAYATLFLDDINVTRYNLLNVSLFLDKNSNGVKDTGEPYFDDANILTSKQGSSNTLITHSAFGHCRIDTDTGSYTTTVVPYRSYYSVVPGSYSNSYSSYLHSDTALFALQPIANNRDVAISLFSQNVARPGFPITYQLICKNKGTDTVAAATVKMVKEHLLNYVSASLLPSSIVADTIIWNVPNVYPDETVIINVNLTVSPPPIINVGDYLVTTATVTSSVTDLYPTDNNAYFSQIARGSYDPNDKIESHGGRIKLLDSLNGDYLQYTIHFQNVGNDTAFNVYVRDTLSNLLDWSSLEMIASNADYRLTITNDNKLLWSFNNINLVDSIKNEPLSHGYLVYRIKPKANVQVGDIITNRAAIYFDYNLPIFTNTEMTTVVAEAFPLKLLSFTAKKQDKANLLKWTTTNEVNVDRFEVERSPNGREFERMQNVKCKMQNEKNEYEYTDPINSQQSSVNTLYYRLKMVDKDGRFEYSPVRVINNSSNFYVSAHPNPVKDILQVEIVSDKKAALQMQIISQDGKVLMSELWNPPSGGRGAALNVSALQSGSYFLRVTSLNPPSGGRGAVVVKFAKL